MRSSGEKLLAAVALLSLAGCAPDVEGIRVLVEFEPGIRSTCIKAFATEGDITRETRPMLLAGATSPLPVAVIAKAGTVHRLRARGYFDEACTEEVPGEATTLVEAVAAKPPSEVILHIGVSQGDGGADGGVPDAGVPDAGSDDAGADAGLDAGLDLDGDGVPQPADCDDMNPSVKPGIAETCGNVIDDNCDGLPDCEDPTCVAMACADAGVCRDGGCAASSEVSCSDGFDNDGDGRTDCLDDECPTGTLCSDFNGCTLGDRCVADGGCEKTGDKACTTAPGTCFTSAGECRPDAGGACVYPTRTGSCSDGLDCTLNDTCNGGACTGTLQTCVNSTNACLASAGVCIEDGGTCFYVPLFGGSCDDGRNCTVNDTCDGDGGCAGTAVTCTPPTECHQDTGSCTDAGTCIFSPRTGQACDAGTMRAGACAANFDCVTRPLSCLDLLTLAPASPTGTYVIDPDGPGAGASFSVTCEMAAGDAGWTLISFEDFSSNANGWSDTSRDTASCGAKWSAMLGGYGEFGSGASPSKTYSLRGVAHTRARVELDYYVIDSWDNEAARVSIDGTRVYDTNFTFGGMNVCGQVTYGDLGAQRVGATVSHSSNSLLLNVTSTLNESATNESFGVDNVRVLVR